MKNQTLLILSSLCLVVCAGAQNSPKQKFAKTEQYVIEVVRLVRDELRDPESFRVSSVKVFDYGDVCIKGRSKNSSGGYLPLQAVAIGKGRFKGLHLIDDHNDYLFDDYCGIRIEGEGKDVTDAVKAALKADREKE